jgi:PAS domain S-box-containing protein
MPPARRRDPKRVDPHVGTRVEAFVQGADLGRVAALLAAGRDGILRRWLEATRLQSFHALHPDRAVADSIPRLFDALVAVLERAAPRTVDPDAPLDDPAVHAAAQEHARVRFEQGLGPADVLTEFRLLRQEIGRELRERLSGAAAADVVGAELLVHDALDGAATLGLAALDAHEADRRRLAAEVVRLGAEKDQALAEVEAARGQLQELFRQAPAIVAVLRGPEHVFALANPLYLRVVGRAEEELIGQPIRAALPELAGQDVFELLDRVHATGEPFVGHEVPVALDRRGDGTLDEAFFTFVYQPMRDASGATTDILVVGHEVTAQVRARAEAQEAVAVRDQVLETASHDLRTPLTAIRAQAQLLERRSGGLPPAERERLTAGLGAIAAATGRMVAIINELLDAAHLRMGEALALERRPTDLVALAERVAAEARETAERHVLRVEAAVPELVGDWDAFRLERVLGNLLSNAVKYSPAGGEVTVRVAREEGPSGPWAVLAVRDRGVGIPAADLPRVFERRHRAANVVGKIRGEGIGLAGARQIVAQHGGAIDVESAQGAGSTLTVRLPLSPADAAAVGGAPPA